MHQDPKDVPMPEPARTQLIAKLRYMGRQYAAGQFARGGGQQKHYLEEAADEIAALSARVAELEANPRNTAFGREAEKLADDYIALNSECAGLRQRVAKLEAGWQPIETAPRDGTQVLLTNGQSVAQGYWLHAEPYIRERRDLEGRYIDQDESDGYDGWIDFMGGMLPEPDRWRPLPPVAAIDAARAGEAE